MYRQGARVFGGESLAKTRPNRRRRRRRRLQRSWLRAEVRRKRGTTSENCRARAFAASRVQNIAPGAMKSPHVLGPQTAAEGRSACRSSSFFFSSKKTFSRNGPRRTPCILVCTPAAVLFLLSSFSPLFFLFGVGNLKVLRCCYSVALETIQVFGCVRRQARGTERNESSTR